MSRLSFLDKSINSMSERFCCGPVNLNTFSVPTKHVHPTSKNINVAQSGGEDEDRDKAGSPTSSMLLQPPRGGNMQIDPFSNATVGNIKSSLSCTYKEKLGILYITQRAIFFRRVGFLGIEVERLIIPFDIVTDLTKGRHQTKQESILVMTKRKEEYHFSNMKDIDQVLSELQLACKEAKESPFVLQKSAVNRLFRSITTLSSSSLDTDALSVSSEGGEKKNVGDNDNELDGTNKNGVVLDLSAMKKDEIEQQVWKDFVGTIHEKQYKQKVVMGTTFNCSVEQFYEKFLLDNATSSIVNYHKQTGDMEVEASNWEYSQQNNTFQRCITYRHPIHVPMGPPSGRAKKTQLLKRFDNFGLCIVSKTWVNDVPMTDCFYVEDCLLVSSNAEGGISVSIMFDLCFVKRTMFKNLITMTSINELSKFHSGFVRVIEEKLDKFVDIGGNGTSDKMIDRNSDNDVPLIEDDVDRDSTKVSCLRIQLEIVRDHIGRVFDTISKRLKEIDLFVWVILFSLLINQLHLSLCLKKVNEKVDLLESIISKTSHQVNFD